MTPTCIFKKTYIIKKACIKNSKIKYNVKVNSYVSIFAGMDKSVFLQHHWSRKTVFFGFSLFGGHFSYDTRNVWLIEHVCCSLTNSVKRGLRPNAKKKQLTPRHICELTPKLTSLVEKELKTVRLDSDGSWHTGRSSTKRHGTVKLSYENSQIVFPHWIYMFYT